MPVMCNGSFFLYLFQNRTSGDNPQFILPMPTW